MSRNSHFTLEETWNAIAKVKSQHNRQKLEEIYLLVSNFVPKYQDKPVSVLLTPFFAQDYLPILRKIISQSAGKKLLISFTANPWVGVTKSIQWMFWLPTRIGSKAAMSILHTYVAELEKQAIVPVPRIQCSVAVQTDDIGLPALLAPSTGDQNENEKPSDSNTFDDSAITSGVGCNTSTIDTSVVDQDGFWVSDGEDEELIIAAALENSRLSNNDSHENPDKQSPKVKPLSLSTPARPRKLTKGSRRSNLKDSGINLEREGLLEESRNVPKTSEAASVINEEDLASIIYEDEVFDWVEIPEVENNEPEEGDEDEGDSFDEIPELE